jgi:hypothetical protein
MPFRISMVSAGRRLVHVDRGEAPREGGVTLEVLAVLGLGGGAHAGQLATRERSLQLVGQIVRALAATDHRVDLVDEQDHAPLGAGDLFLQHPQPLGERATHARPGHQRAGAQLDEHAVLEPTDFVAPRHQAQRQGLHHRRLAHPSRPDQHGVVAPPARQDVQQPVHLGLTPDDRIDAAAGRERGQIAAQLRQRGAELLVQLERLRWHDGQRVHARCRLHDVHGVDHGEVAGRRVGREFRGTPAPRLGSRIGGLTLRHRLPATRIAGRRVIATRRREAARRARGARQRGRLGQRERGTQRSQPGGFAHQRGQTLHVHPRVLQGASGSGATVPQDRLEQVQPAGPDRLRGRELVRALERPLHAGCRLAEVPRQQAEQRRLVQARRGQQGARVGLSVHQHQEHVRGRDRVAAPTCFMSRLRDYPVHATTDARHGTSKCMPRGTHDERRISRLGLLLQIIGGRKLHR